MENDVDNINSIDKLKEILEKKETFKIQVKVIANSKVNLLDFSNDFIKIKITQRAIEGKANKAIIEFLSKTLNVSKSNIKIVLGEKTSNKVIQFY